MSDNESAQRLNSAYGESLSGEASHRTMTSSFPYQKQLRMPKGFADALVTPGDSVEFRLYNTTDDYAPACGRRIVSNEPAIRTVWSCQSGPSISSKDYHGAARNNAEVSA